MKMYNRVKAPLLEVGEGVRGIEGGMEEEEWK